MAIIADHLINICTTGAINYLYEMMEDVYVHHVSGGSFRRASILQGGTVMVYLNE